MLNVTNHLLIYHSGGGWCISYFIQAFVVSGINPCLHLCVEESLEIGSLEPAQLVPADSDDYKIPHVKLHMYSEKLHMYFRKIVIFQHCFGVFFL